MASDIALEVQNLTCSFGGVRALDDLNLSFPRGETRCIIGPNGAGKTTLLNVVCGLVRPSSGRLILNGKNVTGMSPVRIARHGVVRSFQTPTVFPGLTILTNLELGAHRPGAPAAGADDRAHDMLNELGFADRSQTLAAELSHGERKRLEIGMVLAGRPEILLLDEPTAGMGVGETDEIVRMLKRLTDGMTVLVIEHDMSFVRQLEGDVLVLHRGQVLAHGPLSLVQEDPRVRDVYLGSAVH
ncbi:MAG: ATP-binding cassette domain-containing protein [Microcella pacifica]